VGCFDVHGKTIVGIGQGTQVNVEHTGWFSTGANPGTRELISDPRVGTPFQQKPMTDKQRAALEANLEAHGLSAAALDANAKAAYADGLTRMGTDPAIVALGLNEAQAANWYLYEHDSAIAYADHGQSDYVCAAEVAATTSKAQWSMQTGASSVYGEPITVYPNLTAAATVAAFGIENPTITLTQADCDAINIATTSYYDPGVKDDGTPATPLTAIDPTLFANESHPELLQPLVPGDYQADQLSDQQLGKYVDMSGNGLLPGVPIGLPDGLSRGIAIARGADPDDVLNGTKQLSFTTNIAFPDQNTTTTNDTHVGAEMLAGAVYPPDDKGTSTRAASPGQPMSSTDLAAYVQSFYNAQGGAGYTYITESIMSASASEDPPVMGHQYQAVMWVGDPTIAAASTKGVHGELTKASKLDVQFPYRPYTPDDEETPPGAGDALEAPVTEIAKACVVRGDTYKTPPFSKDQRHARRPKWLKDRIARGDFKNVDGKSAVLDDSATALSPFELPMWFKYSPDQERDANGEFGSGSTSTTTSKPQRTCKVCGKPLKAMNYDKHMSTHSDDEKRDAGLFVAAKGFGDPGSTQTRDAHGEFGSAAAPKPQRTCPVCDKPLKAMNYDRHIAAHSQDEKDAAGYVPFHAPQSKGFGDPGSTQSRDSHGEFGPGSADNSDHNVKVGSFHDPINGGRVLQATCKTCGWHGPARDTKADALADVATHTGTTKGFGDPGSTQQQDAHGRFTVGSGAARDASNLKYPELHARDMSAGGTNSPLMTRAEFQASAARGEDIVNEAIANGSPAHNILTGANIQAAVDGVQEKWGGVTIDAHGGGVVSQSSQPPDPLSVSLLPSGSGVVISAAQGTADPGVLMAAMQQAQTQFADQLQAQGAALGVFRDETTGTMQIDPVLVVQGVSTARDVGAYTGATGGAYRFSDGNGYWPGHVA
jgi:hypothetical protein